jgi:hypothetical protein
MSKIISNYPLFFLPNLKGLSSTICVAESGMISFDRSLLKGETPRFSAEFVIGPLYFRPSRRGLGN